MEQINKIINRVEKKKESSRVSKEFQDFGIRLSEELHDLSHKSLYIKLAKEKPRKALQDALSWVLDYPSGQSKGRLFMWKLKELSQSDKSKPK